MNRAHFLSILFLALSAAFFLVPDFRQGLVRPLGGQFQGLRGATCIGGS